MTTLCQRDFELQHYVVALPFEVFTPASISVGLDIWTWLVDERPDLEMGIMLELAVSWQSTIHGQRGLFSSQIK